MSAYSKHNVAFKPGRQRKRSVDVDGNDVTIDLRIASSGTATVSLGGSVNVIAKGIDRFEGRISGKRAALLPAIAPSADASYRIGAWALESPVRKMHDFRHCMVERSNTGVLHSSSSRLVLARAKSFEVRRAASGN